MLQPSQTAKLTLHTYDKQLPESTSRVQTTDIIK